MIIFMFHESYNNRLIRYSLFGKCMQKSIDLANFSCLTCIVYLYFSSPGPQDSSFPRSMAEPDTFGPGRIWNLRGTGTYVRNWVNKAGTPLLGGGGAQ